MASKWQSWGWISGLADVQVCICVSLSALATASGTPTESTQNRLVLGNYDHDFQLGSHPGFLSQAKSGPALDAELMLGKGDTLLPPGASERRCHHTKRKAAATQQRTASPAEALSLERPSSHMWGVLLKKIQITGENTPGTMKP